MTSTQNISSGGIRILLAEKLKVGLEVKVSLFTGKRVQCGGRVVWSVVLDSPYEENVNDIGIEFTDIEASDANFIENLVEKLLNSHG